MAKDTKERSVFEFNDYKSFIEFQLKKNWGEVSRLAKAAGCQRSYFSQVVHGPQHLTPDHAFGLCSYWKMSPEENEYFQLLVQKDRAATLDYRQHLERRLAELKKENENISERLERKNPLTGEKEALYFSAWYWAGIHTLTSIPEFQSVEAIADKLQISKGMVLFCLQHLEQHGLVTKKGSEWLHSRQNIHVSKASPLVTCHHNNWRQKATMHSQTGQDDGLHFTDVRSISRADYERIKNLLLDQIEKIADIAEPSKEEELVNLNLDFYKI